LPLEIDDLASPLDLSAKLKIPQHGMLGDGIINYIIDRIARVRKDPIQRPMHHDKLDAVASIFVKVNPRES
jgi:hypothetical protein